VRSLSKFPQELEKAGARPLVIDFTSPDVDIIQAASSAIEIYGHVDVLVNNAGSNSGVGPVEEIA
jgi:NADP-dependent 3-hydroxy acid dehydrogenase YdfG